METTVIQKRGEWFTRLMCAFNQKANELQLEPEAADEMRQLFIEKCKEQYMVGNKSGIDWERRGKFAAKLKTGNTEQR
jgi:hypothetical protein